MAQQAAERGVAGAAAAHPLGAGVLPAGERLLPLVPALGGLLPDGGLRRGSVLSLEGCAGSSSLLFALLSRPLADGSWGAVVNLPELGLEAAAGAGVPLERLALVPRPGRAWLEVVAALIDAVDIVVVRPPSRCSLSHARRLAARGRERGCVLALAAPPSAAAPSWPAWPEPVDVALSVEPRTWHGLGRGWGTLTSREVAVSSSGRRVARGPRHADLLLPDRTGAVAVGPPEQATAPRRLRLSPVPG